MVQVAQQNPKQTLSDEHHKWYYTPAIIAYKY